MHAASLETYLASDLEERESSPKLPGPPRASFDERFAGAAVSPGSAPARTAETEEEGADNELLRPPRATAYLEERESTPELPVPPRASFDERFAGAAVSPGSAPARTVETEEEGADNEPLQPPERATAHPAVGDPAPQVAPVTSSPLAGASKKRLRTADLLTDLSSPPDVDSQTAIYDIAAHTVYLPDGHRLEAHSGLGGYMDDARYVNVKGRGATPPNIYDLTLRERSFHGVRAIRLMPVDGGKMFGRDGMLAHSYMLGPNGQSNGCLSFSDYSAFLNAFLRGEVHRLVVVEHLAPVPFSPRQPRDGFQRRSRSFRVPAVLNTRCSSARTSNVERRTERLRSLCGGDYALIAAMSG
jgi:hypothetical protein